jgi:hypothetical protein
MDDKLFYDDDLDALKATIQHLGGNKAVGVQLWPDKTPDAAGRSMADCCNTSRSERLSPSQLLFVMRLAREKNCHIMAEHLMSEAGYAKPVPIDPDEEASTIVERIDETLQGVGILVDRLERLRNRTSLKAVG